MLFWMRSNGVPGSRDRRTGNQSGSEKTAAVEAFPEPKDLKELRSYLGLASYYRMFVEGFARIAAPLRALLKKDTPFERNADCRAAFEELKRRLTSAPVLVYPDFERPFLVATDASGN